MISPVKFALIAAIPVEFFQFCLFAYPVDKGFDPGTPWRSRMLADIWLVMHWPALAALRWMEHRGAPALDELLVFFASGYAGMVLLLIALFLLVRWARHVGRQRTPAH